MIERDRDREISFTCDTCGETENSRTDEFNAAWADAKEDGWKTQKVGNDWVHTCPTCARKLK